MYKIILVAASLLSLSVATAYAQNADSYVDEVEGFQKQSIAVQCILKKEIRSVKVLDKDHVLFKMKNGDRLINTLEKECKVMGMSKRITHPTNREAYCSEDGFYTGSASMNTNTHCALGLSLIHI